LSELFGMFHDVQTIAVQPGLDDGTALVVAAVLLSLLASMPSK
jgi:hypothetical protein